MLGFCWLARKKLYELYVSSSYRTKPKLTHPTGTSENSDKCNKSFWFCFYMGSCKALQWNTTDNLFESEIQSWQYIVRYENIVNVVLFTKTSMDFNAFRHYIQFIDMLVQKNKQKATFKRSTLYLCWFQLTAISCIHVKCPSLCKINQINFWKRSQLFFLLISTLNIFYTLQLLK